MKKIGSLWYSVIEYAVDPTDPDSSIPLGVVCELDLPDARILQCFVRPALDSRELARLDDIGRELLRSPIEIVKREIEAALPLAPGTSPGILRALAERSDWCLRVRPPKARAVKVGEGVEAEVRRQLGTLYDGIVGKRMARDHRPERPAVHWSPAIRGQEQRVAAPAAL